MFKFIRNRVLGAIGVLFAAVFAVFTILTYLPGSRLGYLPIQGDNDLLDRFFAFI